MALSCEKWHAAAWAVLNKKGITGLSVTQKSDLHLMWKGEFTPVEAVALLIEQNPRLVQAQRPHVVAERHAPRA